MNKAIETQSYYQSRHNKEMRCMTSHNKKESEK